MDDLYFRELRTSEFSRLDRLRQVYLDYTGSGLYPESMIGRHCHDLQSNLFGNPHSRNPASAASTIFVKAARRKVQDFFAADPEEFEVIFTPNATGALKMVAESLPFNRDSILAMTVDNHNSVNGMREFVRRRGGEIRYIPVSPELRAVSLSEHLPKAKKGSVSLFAYPAQSNFSGVRHSLGLLGQARSRDYLTVLDAAAYVPTSALNLSSVKPDFTCISFYKMFGFPTGLGALIARREVLAQFRRPWFGGGTVAYAPSDSSGPVREGRAEAFEDGTLHFLGIAAISGGLDFLSAVGMERIGRHVAGLTEVLLSELKGMCHSNGQPMIQIYGPLSMQDRGGVVTFNVLDENSRVFECGAIEKAAAAQRISLRTGGFCNPGATEAAFNAGRTDSFTATANSCPDDYVTADGAEAATRGAVRVSFGVASVESDVSRMCEFLLTFRNTSCSVAGDKLVPYRM